MTPRPNPEEPSPPPRVSVVVVSHSRADFLRKCLESLEKTNGRESVQVIVVDNGSWDESLDLEPDFPKVRFFRLPKNFGLTKAMNIGWRAAEAESILFLHEDTEVEPEAIERLAAVLETTSEAAAVCPLLVDDTGQPAPQLGNLPPDGHWRPAPVAGSDPVVVEYPRGAALLVRSFVLKSIRQIDERFGQFGSDADLAAQIRRGSRKILLVPEARVRHHGGTHDSALRRADLLLARAVWVGKHRGFGAGLWARLTILLGLLASFRFSEFRFMLAGQKIDGTQM